MIKKIIIILLISGIMTLNSEFFGEPNQVLGKAESYSKSKQVNQKKGPEQNNHQNGQQNQNDDGGNNGNCNKNGCECNLQCPQPIINLTCPPQTCNLTCPPQTCNLTCSPPIVIPPVCPPVNGICPIPLNCFFAEVDNQGANFGCAKCDSGYIVIRDNGADKGGRCQQIGTASAPPTIQGCLWQELENTNKNICNLCEETPLNTISTNGFSCEAGPPANGVTIPNCFSYYKVNALGGTYNCARCDPGYILLFDGVSDTSCALDDGSTYPRCSTAISSCNACIVDIRNPSNTETLCLECEEDTIALHDRSDNLPQVLFELYKKCYTCTEFISSVFSKTS